MSGVEVVKWWHMMHMMPHICEAFDDIKRGRYGRRRRIGTGKGSRDQRNVIMQDSESKGCREYGQQCCTLDTSTAPMECYPYCLRRRRIVLGQNRYLDAER